MRLQPRCTTPVPVILVFGRVCVSSWAEQSLNLPTFVDRLSVCALELCAARVVDVDTPQDIRNGKTVGNYQ